MTSIEEMMKTAQEEAARTWEAQSLRLIEEFWPSMIQQMARMNDIGPGPNSSLTPNEVSIRIKDLVQRYEEIYHEVFRGREEMKSNGF